MKSVWSGQLAFGLVMIPVKLFKATESHDIGFHQHHGPTCLGRIKQIRTCADCGAVVAYGEIVRGTDSEDGETVIITDDDFVLLTEEAGKQIEILQFVEASEIEPMMFENSYYMGTVEGSKPYALLLQSMKGESLVAIGRFALRNKTQLCAIRVVEGVLVLHTLQWPDELRKPDEVPGLGGDFSAAEIKAAHAVVQSMVGKFDPDAYTDVYQERLRELVAAKAIGEKYEPLTVTQLDANVNSLIEKLEASVKRHPAGKKRAAPKKAPAKRTSRKREVA